MATQDQDRSFWSQPEGMDLDTTAQTASDAQSSAVSGPPDSLPVQTSDDPVNIHRTLVTSDLEQHQASWKQQRQALLTQLAQLRYVACAPHSFKDPMREAQCRPVAL